MCLLTVTTSIVSRLRENAYFPPPTCLFLAESFMIDSRNVNAGVKRSNYPVPYVLCIMRNSLVRQQNIRMPV